MSRKCAANLVTILRILLSLLLLCSSVFSPAFYAGEPDRLRFPMQWQDLFTFVMLIERRRFDTGRKRMELLTMAGRRLGYVVEGCYSGSRLRSSG